MALTASRRQGLEILTHIGSHVAEFLAANGIPPDVAKFQGKTCAARIGTDFGGQIFYLPRDVAGRVEQTHRAIVAKFNGSNHADLADEFGVCVQTIYKILKTDRMRRQQAGADSTSQKGA